jgi:alkylation response protein AidB-like acyl-CoA dehydrogenase
VDLVLSGEQIALREVVRAMFDDTHPSARLAALADSEAGWDQTTWPVLVEMGLLGLSVPEEHGGAGAGLVEEAILFEEAGSALLPGPLFSTVALALPALLAGEHGRELVPEVVAGRRRVGFAWIDEGRVPYLSRAGETTLSARMRPASHSAVLNGVKKWVMDVECVDALVVAAKTEDGAGLFLVERSHPGLTWARVEGVDGTRRMSTVTLDSVPGVSLVDPSNSTLAFRRIWRRGALLAAAEAVGMARRLVAMSADYAGTREQFGRPIGTFQAVSHQIVNAHVHTELARSLCWWAAAAIDGADESADVAVAAAAARALPNATAAAELAIQVFGGVGMTWESNLHRYFRRALLMCTMDGPPASQRRFVAGMLFQHQASRPWEAPSSKLIEGHFDPVARQLRARPPGLA